MQKIVIVLHIQYITIEIYNITEKNDCSVSWVGLREL